MKIGFVLLIFFTYSASAQQNSMNSLGWIVGSYNNTLNVSDKRTSNEQDENEEEFDEDVQEILEADVAAPYATNLGLRYTFNTSIIRFYIDYFSTTFSYTDPDENLDEEESELYLNEYRGSMWIYTGLKSAFIISAASKDIPYLDLSEDETELVMKKDKVSFASITLEQIIVGSRMNSLGFRVKGDAISSGTRVKARQGGSVHLYYELEFDSFRLNLEFGGSQHYYDVTHDELDFQTTSKSMGGNLLIDIKF
ncbi:hypothetical protein N9N67_12125 [Bacteriovoracaceae bacterium]|nr:hypothetical protein [Bacteriovoracaceae bacterium]